MNEKPIKEALRRMAHKRTAHHVDLWARIEPQVKPRQRRIAPHLRLATPFGAVLVIVLLLTVGVGAYAAIEHLSLFVPDFDPGMQHVQEDELGATLSESQTVDGVTLQLDWVYADAHRVALYYSLTRAVSPYAPVNITALDIQLRTADGAVLPQIFGGGGGGTGGGMGGGGGEGSAVTPAPYTSWSFSGSMNFDTASISGSPSDLALHLDLRVNFEAVPVAGGSSEMVGLGPFSLDFSAPFIPAVVLEPEISETAGNITLTLEQVSVTPSSTKTTLCVTGDEQYWLPEAQLNTGDDVLSDIGFIGLAPQTSRTGTASCVVLDFLAPYRGEPALWTLSVDRMQRVTLDGSLIAAVDGPWVYQVAIP